MAGEESSGASFRRTASFQILKWVSLLLSVVITVPWLLIFVVVPIINIFAPADGGRSLAFAAQYTDGVLVPIGKVFAWPLVAIAVVLCAYSQGVFRALSWLIRKNILVTFPGGASIRVSADEQRDNADPDTEITPNATPKPLKPSPFRPESE